MKRERLHGFIALALLMLSGCVSTVIAPDGSKMSETIYAHTLSVQAYERTADASSSCYARATTELGLAICGLNGRAGQSANVPQYIAPPTFIDRVAQLAPLALGVGQLVASDRSNARQAQAGVDIARIGAQRELGLVQAATGSNERIANGGFDALGNAATSANYASAANVQALAGMVANLPPTTQIVAGRDVIQARDVDQSATAGDRVSGDGNRLRNTVACNAQGGNGAPATAGNNSGSGGATSPLNAGYNPLISGGAGAAGSNDCGGG